METPIEWDQRAGDGVGADAALGAALGAAPGPALAAAGGGPPAPAGGAAPPGAPPPGPPRLISTVRRGVPSFCRRCCPAITTVSPSDNPSRISTRPGRRMPSLTSTRCETC
ncbi:MAG: hypothetical protein EB096_11975 [Betaproteobacteria bacterium]|nr:hypothetical protein [Betaproteobacteria bacterium]